MLTQREGTADAIRRLLAESIIPSLENDAKSFRIILAEGHESAARQRLRIANVERHDFPELCFCLSGVAEIWAGGTCRRLTRGHILIVPAGVLHSTGVLHALLSRPESISSRLLWMGVFPYGAVINLCESQQGVHRSTPRQLFLERHIHSHIQDLALELRQADYKYELLARCNLLQALTRVCRSVDIAGQDGELAAVGPPEAAASDDTIVGRARKFIHHNFDSPVNLERIARAVFTHKAHLCREFKRGAGMTVMHYLARVRVDASKRLLLTSLKISAISQLVGYDDPYYYSRVFKKLTGLSPSEFRARQRDDLAE